MSKPRREADVSPSKTVAARSVVFDLPDEQSTQRLAESVRLWLVAPLLITFSGEIGAGKTTFIRAVLRSLGITRAIKSPTFALLESYDVNEVMIHHLDLYRIESEEELDYIGLRELLSDKALLFIEWPERAVHYLNQVDLTVKFDITAIGGRRLTLSAQSTAGMILLESLLASGDEYPQLTSP